MAFLCDIQCFSHKESLLYVELRCLIDRLSSILDVFGKLDEDALYLGTIKEFLDLPDLFSILGHFQHDCLLGLVGAYDCLGVAFRVKNDLVRFGVDTCIEDGDPKIL